MQPNLFKYTCLFKTFSLTLRLSIYVNSRFFYIVLIKAFHILAMKMEHILKAPQDAKIKSIGGAEGDNIAKGAAVIIFEDEKTE